MSELQRTSDAEQDDEVANDAIQLMTVATFNGVCRVVAALSRNGLLDPDQLENIHDCMTTTLDDPDWRDYTFIAETRDVVERVLAQSMKEARDWWSKEPDPGSSPG